MSTQAEPQHPPVQTYPTSPPWASPPAAAPQPAQMPPPPPMPVAYGQLLVPYPEEMRNAARPIPPSWWPIAALTLLLPILGLVSTIRRGTQARRGRNSQAPYWITFAVSWFVTGLVWGGIFLVGTPLYVNHVEAGATKAVQQNIVKDGQLKAKSRLTATSASCDPTGARADDGQRLYTCLLKLDDGRTGTIDVTADTDGNWIAVPLTKVR
jgi:hypothetical protein